MGLFAMAKAKAKATNTDMGLLLVFFPNSNSNTNTNETNTNTNLNFTTPNPTFKRTNSNNLILSKTQSTLSICALLFFLTLLLFTLSTFEPNTTANYRHKPPISSPTTTTTKTTARHVSSSNNWLFPKRLWPNKPQQQQLASEALQRMGTLYRRGTRAMPDLLVCHVADDTAVHDFRLFLRLIHRSGITARSDVVFLFASRSLSSPFTSVIRQENDAFSALVELHSELNSTRWSQSPGSSFDLARFSVRAGKKRDETGEPLWGKKRIRTNSTDAESSLRYGSVIGFDAAELDPENSLAGFMDRVPLSLQRWACYPMLLGRVRRSFKHVMLVDAKSVLILGDALGRVRNRSSESVFLFAKHSRRSSDPAQRTVNPAVVMGGARGVRRLANAVLVEIVRAAMQQRGRRKSSVSESAILTQLGANDSLLRGKGVELVDSGESLTETSQLGGGGSTSLSSNHAIIQRGTSNHDFISSAIKKQICSSVVDSSVYRDC